MKLNDEQRRAVEHGAGPLLIVAGAGTGKTRVLIERLGYLLKSVNGLKPQNILALTFSRKAAAEMRERAEERFGAAAAGARFSTFHSYCFDLISDAKQSRLLDDTDLWIFLRRNLEKLDLEHYFKVSEPGRFLSDLVKFASHCQDNLVTPVEYDAYVDALETQGPLALSPKTSGKKSKKANANPDEEFKKEVKRQREVARVFRLLEQMQDDENYMSFGAMITRAVRLLDASPEAAEQQRQRYRYILVDEFQDTNTAQFELLRRLVGHERNITVVGDDDQAIYRFRGASYASFDRFKEEFPDSVRVTLDRNYRSTGSILAVSGVTISRNRNRFEAGKKLKPAKPHGPPVEVWEFAEDSAPARYTAAQIARAVESRALNASKGKPLNYSSFAVLYRAHTHRDPLVQEFRARGIPFTIRGLAINFLGVIRDLVALLRTIGDSADSVSLARVLSSFARQGDWQMPPKMLEACCRRAGMERIRLDQSVADAEWHGKDDFTKFIAKCRARALEVRVAAWLPLLMADVGLPREDAETQPLAIFRQFVETWDKDKCATGLLDEFLEYFAYFEEAGGRITLPEDEPESENASMAAPSRQAPPMQMKPRAWKAGAQGELFPDEAEALVEADPGGVPAKAGAYPLGRVQLMTVHAAKGLEFDHVFVWQLISRAFPQNKKNPLIELPVELWKGKVPTGDFHLEEERRLFYVALTRARESLTLVTVTKEKRKPSVFLDELKETPASDLMWVKPISEAVVRRQVVPDEPPLGIIPKQDKARPISLSISQLETYLDCPLRYYFNYVLGIPMPRPPAMLFGTAMHNAAAEILKEAFGNKRSLSEAELEAVLNKHWSERGFEDPVQEAKYREQGSEQLRRLYSIWKDRPIQLLHQERPFSMQLAGCPVSGRIDLVYRNEQDEVELLDFKSGRPKTQKETDDMRQLTLYAEACRKVLGMKAQSIALYNLGGAPGEEHLHTERTQRHLNDLEVEVLDTHQRIAAGTFPATPSFNCRYCAYRAICPEQEEALT